MLPSRDFSEVIRRFPNRNNCRALFISIVDILSFISFDDSIKSNPKQSINSQQSKFNEGKTSRLNPKDPTGLIENCQVCSRFFCWTGDSEEAEQVGDESEMCFTP